jgi:hypothetical protein
MKICPQCDTDYPDNAVTCPSHGGIRRQCYSVNNLGFQLLNGAGVQEDKEKARQML